MGRLPESLIRYMEERNAQEAALGLRGYGRKKVDEALADIDETLKDVVHPSVRNPYDERTGLLDLLEDIVGGVGQYEEIPRDGAAMGALEEFALAVGIAFELGMAAVLGEANPAAVALFRAAAKGYRQGGRNGGGKSNKDAAAFWQGKATPVYQELRAKYPKESASKLADLIIVEVQLLGYKLPSKTRVERWVSAMDKVTPTYLELRAKFPVESANDIADRIIGKLGDPICTKSAVARWVSTMDRLRRPPA
jgi:hypothetical protein